MYLIDSDVFIDAANRHYSFDVVPAFWDWIVMAHKAAKVFTVDQVAQEILAPVDLATWMTSQPQSFKLKPGPNDQPSLKKVSQWAASASYSQGAAATFLQAGDYFL